MLTPPKTLKEARAYRYGQWAGNPRGQTYTEGRCAMGVWSPGRGPMESQCSRPNGHGPCGLFCKTHDPVRRKQKENDRRREQAQKEFLGLGTELAMLKHSLHEAGCHMAARKVGEAEDLYSQDVDRIMKMRKKEEEKKS